MPLFHNIADAPTHVAPFSHAVKAEGWVLLTGQMPTVPGASDAPLEIDCIARRRKIV